MNDFFTMGSDPIVIRESRPNPQSENTHERDLGGKGLKHWLRDGGGEEGSRERWDRETWTGKYWLRNDGEEKV
jgi:hypothetical protein